MPCKWLVDWKLITIPSPVLTFDYLGKSIPATPAPLRPRAAAARRHPSRLPSERAGGEVAPTSPLPSLPPAAQPGSARRHTSGALEGRINALSLPVVATGRQIYRGACFVSHLSRSLSFLPTLGFGRWLRCGASTPPNVRGVKEDTAVLSQLELSSAALDRRRDNLDYSQHIASVMQVNIAIVILKLRSV